MSTAGVKERAYCSRVTQNHMKMLQGEREAESNSGNMSEFFYYSLSAGGCNAELRLFLAYAGSHMLMIRAHTDAVSLIRQVDGRQPLKYAVISWCLSPHVSFTSYLAYLYLSHKDLGGSEYCFDIFMSSRENNALIDCPLS